jgi:hypothetical protein
MDIRNFWKHKAETAPAEKPKWDPKTRHFLHENNPNLEEMRADWKRRFYEMAATPELLNDKAYHKALFKEENTLWSRRQLLGFDPMPKRE